MQDFFPDQRWTSEGEPELGVGIVTEIRHGRVQLVFPRSGEVRLYAAASAPLRRVLFKIGDTIYDREQRPLVVDRVQEDGELMLYHGAGRTLSEADLGEVSVSYGAIDKLEMGEVDGPADFALRRETLELNHQRSISPINGFVGGRIDLIPHQLYIAHEVSQRYAARVLLSDEVGLGKTIEACLIVHRLLQSGRISRVLILVPESLVHQWFVEMLRRFNLWFNIFDEERCIALEDNAPEGNPFLDDQLIICSTSFLANSPKRARQAIQASWDMLVVDEAHRLAWSPEEASPAYMVVEILSQIAQGLLLLTATPEQLGLESHFARLRLLDPDRYHDFEIFKQEASAHQEVATLVEKLAEKKSLTKGDKELVEQLLGEERAKTLEQNQADEHHHLIEDLLDQHGPGRVLFRNTRAAMHGFPARHFNAVKLQGADDMWLQRMTQEFEQDQQQTGAQQFWFDKDPRVKWLLSFLDKVAPAKVLLICNSKAKVLALEESIRKRSSIKVGVFHEELNIVQRDRNAAWFAEPQGARLLICSEIGSEGRNFQFAHNLILFDLPINPELLEQRIGRLDRIGQTHDIQIHVPFLPASPQEVLVRWYHEGLNAFEQNLIGGNRFSHRFQAPLLELASSSPVDAKQLDVLIQDTSSFRQELQLQLAQGRDRLIEMNSFRPEVSAQLVDQIQAADQDHELEKYMTKVFETFAVEMEDLAPRTYLLHPSRENKEAFPSIPHEGVSVTFDRKRALSREDMRFLSWDHPMAVAAIDMVLGSGMGSASFGILRGGTRQILLEALFVLETMGGKALHVDRFLPQTPLRIVVNLQGENVTADYPVEMFNKRLLYAPIDPLLENETFVESMLPNMVSDATAFAESTAMLNISKALRDMRTQLSHEIERLRSLAKKNGNIRSSEIELAEAEKDQLEGLIIDAQIRLDAVLLVQAG